MYRLLKQWRTVGKKEFTIDELKLNLDIPESYSTGMIKKRVIEQSVKELGAYFKGIKYKSIKSNRHGNPVIAYEFTWKAETTSKYNPNKYQKKKKKDELKPYWATEETNATSKEVESSENQANNELKEL